MLVAWSKPTYSMSICYLLTVCQVPAYPVSYSVKYQDNKLPAARQQLPLVSDHTISTFMWGVSMPGLVCTTIADARVFELAKFLPVFHELAVDAPSVRKLLFKRAMLPITSSECLCCFCVYSFSRRCCHDNKWLLGEFCSVFLWFRIMICTTLAELCSVYCDIIEIGDVLLK